MRVRFFPLWMAMVVVIAVACSSGPRKSAGEQHLEYAQTNLARMEFSNALTNLEQLVKNAGESPLGDQGKIMRVLLLTAMADGSKRMAEAYDQGSKQPGAEARKMQFVKMRSDYYGISRVRLLAAMEGLMGQRSGLGDKAMPLGFDFPGFSGTEHAALKSVEGGNWVDESDRYRAELESVRNALARAMASIAGAGDDLHKGQAAFQSGAVQVDPRVYLIELSNTFLRLSEIFDRRALDDARYLRISHEVIRDNADLALKLLAAKPDAELEKQAKKIRAECEKKLKALTGG